MRVLTKKLSNVGASGSPIGSKKTRSAYSLWYSRDATRRPSRSTQVTRSCQVPGRRPVVPEGGQVPVNGHQGLDHRAVGNRDAVGHRGGVPGQGPEHHPRDGVWPELFEYAPLAVQEVDVAEEHGQEHPRHEEGQADAQPLLQRAEGLIHAVKVSGEREATGRQLVGGASKRMDFLRSTGTYKGFFLQKGGFTR